MNRHGGEFRADYFKYPSEIKKKEEEEAANQSDGDQKWYILIKNKSE